MVWKSRIDKSHKEATKIFGPDEACEISSDSEARGYTDESMGYFA